MNPPRVAIEDPSPTSDGGRFATKALVGERCRIACDLYGEADEPVCGRIAFRGPGAGEWRTEPLRRDSSSRRFTGELLLDRAGRWQWTLEAWPERAPDAVARLERSFEIQAERARAATGAWYELFARSCAREPGRHGTFADVERMLPELAELGVDVLHLAPIHPIGRSRRKGRAGAERAAPGDPGSPWAIGAREGGHTAVHPELGTLADFEHLVQAARARGIELALEWSFDCSPDHPWRSEHPGWFAAAPRDDLWPLDFWCDEREALWQACLDALRFWCERGVRAFVMTAPETRPQALWDWLLPELAHGAPDVVSVAKSFADARRLRRLAASGFSLAYTHFPWKHAGWELGDHVAELAAARDVLRPLWFVNPPELASDFLARFGPAAFRARLLLAATLGSSYGIAAGFEWCEADLREEIFALRPREPRAAAPLRADVARVNRIRRENPALLEPGNLELLRADDPELLWYRRSVPGNDLLVAVNLDPRRVRESMVEVPLAELGLRRDEPFVIHDLLCGERYRWQGSRNYVRLDPVEKVGHVLRLERPGEASLGPASGARGAYTSAPVRGRFLSPVGALP
jgi:starch synthase (maltosyl-transferring)